MSNVQMFNEGCERENVNFLAAAATYIAEPGLKHAKWMFKGLIVLDLVLYAHAHC